MRALFDFIDNSPTPFHTVDSVKKALLDNGFTELSEKENYELESGKGYFVIRGGSSLIAFVYRGTPLGFTVTASHSDCPAFLVKGDLKGAYTRLDLERYGGMILYSWLDKPLGVAGRVVVNDNGEIKSKLFSSDVTTVIPSVAIHLNRGVNDGYKFNPAVDMLPLYSLDGDFLSNLAIENDIDKDSILSHDLYLYNRERGLTFGADKELILSPRLDDLSCVHASLLAFLSAGESDATPVLAVFNNEEVGSETKQGAASTFLSDTLYRISGDRETYLKALASSFMVSADNAHALHPNHPELSDKSNAPLLGKGIVIKHNANQRYTTDAVSDAIFTSVCKRAEVRTQSYYNRADMLGGSTLGSISDTVVSMPTVDIGLPQLAMHSSSETIAKSDYLDMIKALTELYSSKLSDLNVK